MVTHFQTRLAEAYYFYRLRRNVKCVFSLIACAYTWQQLGGKSTMNRSSQWASDKMILLQQIEAVEEIRSKQTELYMLHNSVEHKRLEQLLHQYIKHIKSIVSLHEPPKQQLVLLNHRIEIQYLDDGFIDTLCIVLPSEVNPESGKISLLSPVGQQLLLAPLHSLLDLHTPAGLVPIKIMNITSMAA